MPDWLIKIVSVPKDPEKTDAPTAKFDPSSQMVLASDNITWSNQTDDPHQPVPLDPTAPAWGVDEVPAHQSSNPTYSVVAPVDPTTKKPVYAPVSYYCKNHPKEIGELNIVATPPTFP